MRKNRVLILVLALVLLFGVSVGGTLAWLLDKTDEVTNVFTTSDIDVELKENTTEYKMIPGWTIDKDPIVTVKAGSEDCWVFIKVEETGGDVKVDGTTYSFDDFIAYKIDPNNWTQLLDGEQKPVEGVYYTKYGQRNDVDIAIKVLSAGSYTDPMGTDTVGTDDVTISWDANQVGVKPSVTKEMMNALNETGATMPKLTFTAYASQLMKNNDTEFTAYEAWVNVSTATP